MLGNRLQAKPEINRSGIKSQATNLGAKRDIFEILLQHYCLAVRADEIHLEPAHLKTQKSDLFLKWGSGRHEILTQQLLMAIL